MDAAVTDRGGCDWVETVEHVSSSGTSRTAFNDGRSQRDLSR